MPRPGHRAQGDLGVAQVEVMDDPGRDVGVRRDEPGRDPAGSFFQRRRGEDGAALELELQLDRADAITEPAIDRDLGRVQPAQGDTFVVQPGEVVRHHLAQDPTATMVGVHGNPRQPGHGNPGQSLHRPGGGNRHVV